MPSILHNMMQISLPQQLEELIQEKIAAGLYYSVNELMATAVYLLDQHDKLRAIKIEELRKELEPALKELDEGKGTPLDMEEIIRSARAERVLAQKRG